MKLLNSAGDPYEIAIVAYALMLSKAENAEYAFEILSKRVRNEGTIHNFAKMNSDKVANFKKSKI